MRTITANFHTDADSDIRVDILRLESFQHWALRINDEGTFVSNPITIFATPDQIRELAIRLNDAVDDATEEARLAAEADDESAAEADEVYA